MTQADAGLWKRCVYFILVIYCNNEMCLHVFKFVYVFMGGVNIFMRLYSRFWTKQLYEPAGYLQHVPPR